MALAFREAGRVTKSTAGDTDLPRDHPGAGADGYRTTPVRCADLHARIRADPRERLERPAELPALLGVVVSRDTPMPDPWDEHRVGSTTTLDDHVAELRRRLSAAAGGAEVSRDRDIARNGYELDERPLAHRHRC